MAISTTASTPSTPRSPTYSPRSTTRSRAPGRRHQPHRHQHRQAGDVRRFRDVSAFAAPLPSPPGSGENSGRHGLHRGGNRQLNAALYRIANDHTAPSATGPAHSTTRAQLEHSSGPTTTPPSLRLAARSPTAPPRRRPGARRPRGPARPRGCRRASRGTRPRTPGPLLRRSPARRGAGAARR
jgi:hypothetical protein